MMRRAEYDKRMKQRERFASASADNGGENKIFLLLRNKLNNQNREGKRKTNIEKHEK
jgi:hypothetical protein